MRLQYNYKYSNMRGIGAPGILGARKFGRKFWAQGNLGADGNLGAESEIWAQEINFKKIKNKWLKRKKC